jgi:hypothetical protein
MVIEMKVAKIKKKEIKEEVSSVEEYSLAKMFKIIVILLLLFALFYFITTVVVKNRTQTETNTPTVVDSSKITLSQLLSRKEDEYYVIATKPSLYGNSYVSTDYINFYNDYINKYKQKEESLSFYYVDLDSALNKNYFGEELNIADDISKLKLNDEVLFKIKNKKIEKTYVGKDKILDKLSRLSEKSFIALKLIFENPFKNSFNTLSVSIESLIVFSALIIFSNDEVNNTMFF